MQRLRRNLGLFAVVALIGTVLLPASAAQAQTTYEVQVGAALFAAPEAKGAPADGMRFYTPALSVRPGDTVQFTIEGFHTATLLPANVDPDAWIADNVAGIGKPWSLIVPDPDEGEAGVKFNNKVLFPSPLDCGRPDDPCIYDGSSVVNSGVINPDDLQGPNTFSVTINADPGDVVTLLCLVHIPNMRKTLTVVDATEEAMTQEEIDAYRDRTVTRDARRAGRLHRELLAAEQDRGPVVDAWAGYGAGGVELLAFYPRRIVLREGQRVRWHFDKLVYEDHTVTFPVKKGLRIAGQSFLPVCDPDGDAGTTPDEPANQEAATLEEACAGGVDRVEVDVHPKFGPPAGDGMVTSPRDFESSGIRGAPSGLQEPYTLRFPEEGKFTYLCLVHPFMRGKVVVG